MSSETAWFSQPNSQHLSGRLDSIRKILPLPLEKINSPDPDKLAVLVEMVESASASNDVINLAYQLTSRELELVFPLLAVITLATAPDRQAERQTRLLAERLTLVIRERACPSLYINGWLTLQKYYPCQPLANAFTVLCRILEIKQMSAPVNASTMTLISKIAPPDSRQFLQRLVRAATGDQTNLDLFLKQFMIDPSLALATALFSAGFINDDKGLSLVNFRLFGRCLRQSELATQIKLLQYFFALKGLSEPVRNRCCQQIYRVFDDPAAKHPIWDQVREKDRTAFQSWVRAATIGTHCREVPAKAEIYLKHAACINHIEQWDADTLLIHFRSFIVADSRLQPQMAIYYEKAAKETHPFELANSEFNPNPADPAIPRRPIEDAIRSGDFSGIIGLPFDRKGIRLTTVFLNLRMKGRRR